MNLLRMALLLNSSSCLLFGLVFLLLSGSVNEFIGNDYKWVIPYIGAALLFNGLHLLIASNRKSPVRAEILYFVLGDFLWVMGSIALVLMGVGITSTYGIIVSLLISAMVGSFGVMQLVCYKAQCA